MELGFEWDEEKATTNKEKHGISFEEATTIFLDPLSLTISDPDHSAGEQRYIEIGISDNSRILLASYTERIGRIRLISCRKATRRERRQYEEAIQ